MKSASVTQQERKQRQLQRNDAAIFKSTPGTRERPACADRLSPAFAPALESRTKARESGLGVAAGGGNGNAKDGIEAIHRAIARYFIAQPERVQASFDACVNAHRVHVDGSVDGTRMVADGDAPAVTAVPLTGVFSCNGKHFLVDGQRLYALDELCFHGVISPLDIGWFHGIEGAVAMVLRHAREHLSES